MTGERHDRPAESGSNRIEADIAATRDRMAETVEELGARLNPGRLKREAGRRVTVAARKSLIPAAITAAVGFVWLFWRRSKKNHQKGPRSFAALRNRLSRH